MYGHRNFPLPPSLIFFECTLQLDKWVWDFWCNLKMDCVLGLQKTDYFSLGLVAHHSKRNITYWLERGLGVKTPGLIPSSVQDLWTQVLIYILSTLFSITYKILHKDNSTGQNVLYTYIKINQLVATIFVTHYEHSYASMKLA